MIALRVEVPIACFRQSRAREYIETYLVPPPATVYGMLLSITGETNRYLHCGTQLAIALTKELEKSTVVRTVHRFKTRDVADSSNIRLDYQELVTGVELIVWVAAGSDKSRPTLPERIQEAFANPALITRFGGLCLGESHDLVNAINIVGEEQQEALYWLVQSKTGYLTLPYWVNHLGLKGTYWKRYELQKLMQPYPSANAWTEIQSYQYDSS
ncbi:MAG: type I-MYXAN CRISPR-associated protein Cas5/Cmx5/DevS [Tildeniella nuda ZEHNDER 1965/U140]|jgi:CRISPR-associated protein Cas5t|nr:type I-MYXAN CRISPR-associated protein Cas5/Cmx5/DevS [Tildeniella nuda ZEHNDER 1965/U140]